MSWNSYCRGSELCSSTAGSVPGRGVGGEGGGMERLFNEVTVTEIELMTQIQERQFCPRPHILIARAAVRFLFCFLVWVIAAVGQASKDARYYPAPPTPPAPAPTTSPIPTISHGPNAFATNYPASDPYVASTMFNWSSISSENELFPSWVLTERDRQRSRHRYQWKLQKQTPPHPYPTPPPRK